MKVLTGGNSPRAGYTGRIGGIPIPTVKVRMGEGIMQGDKCNFALEYIRSGAFLFTTLPEPRMSNAGSAKI